MLAHGCTGRGHTAGAHRWDVWVPAVVEGCVGLLPSCLGVVHLHDWPWGAGRHPPGKSPPTSVVDDVLDKG